MKTLDFRRLRSPIHFHTALGESILRLRRGPSPRAYSWNGITLFSFYSASRNPSCAFGAALLQGPTHGAESLSFPFIPPRGSILRLWRGPSPRAYSWSGFTLFSFHSASRIHPAPLARPFSKGLLMERIHSLSLSFRLEDPSCAFDAPLLQEPAANSPKRKRASFR